MVRMIALNGAIKGSVKLNMGRSRTSYELRPTDGVKLRRAAKTGCVIVFASEDGMEYAPLEKTEGSVTLSNVTCIALFDIEGRVISEGYIAQNAEKRRRLKERIRLFASGRAFSAPAGKEDLPQVEQSETYNSEIGSLVNESVEQRTAERSPVTARILSQARTLFNRETAVLDRVVHSTIDDAVKYNDTTNKAVENPFPKQFPNSVWKRTDGERVIQGLVKHNGQMYSVDAVPVFIRYRPKDRVNFIRISVGTDRIRYRLFFKKA